MTKTLKERVVVKEGGVIEIRSPDLPSPGTPAEVVVTFEAPAPSWLARPLASLFGSCEGGFANPKEADEFIRRERDAWDS